MRILHYALGFPPYRTGGLTKYCTDLMLTQRECKNEVALLWPGEIHFFFKESKIKERRKWNGIRNFELINPLPVSLDEGIRDIDSYTKSTDESMYSAFLKKYMPDVIHVHTLMGLHKEFFRATKQLKIKTVFTTHDYFGICPKVTLFHDGRVCDNDNACIDCVKCNQSALSLKKIMILQSPMYRQLKNTMIVKAIRNRHRQNYFAENEKSNCEIVVKEETIRNYQKLRRYYVSMLEMIDCIHFNSSVSKTIYERYIHPKRSVVISITHRDIVNHCHIKDFKHDVLRITYLGPTKPFKGFYYLLGMLDEIWSVGAGRFELHLYAKTSENRPYIIYKQNGYRYGQLKEIFDATDLLIVPSQWYETFGYTVLEALSYGVPVQVTEKVGAKDLIQAINPKFVCVDKELKLKKEELERFNRNLCNRKKIIKTEDEHIKEIISLYGSFTI